jgi:hypothetical protein
LDFAAQAALLIDNLRAMCEGVESGGLVPSEAIGFGLSRAVGEWSDDDLLNAALELERFYWEEAGHLRWTIWFLRRIP